MKFEELEIPGVLLIKAEPFSDERGVFFRHFCRNDFKKAGIDNDIKQTNVSKNLKKHTLRGFHYQISPFQEAKTMFCMTGAFHVKVADLRKGSKTFMEHISVELNEKELKSLHIPKGCAVAFLTLEDNSSMLYYMYEFFREGAYSGFRFNDPAFGFKWPFEPKVISDKDKNYPNFDADSIK